MKLLAIIAFAIVAFGCCCVPPLPPEPTPTPEPSPYVTPAVTQTPGNGSLAEWTFMLYLDGDNNLEDAALADMNELEQVGSTDKVNLVVQLDRSVNYDEGDGNWRGARRYLVERDEDTGAITSRPLQELGNTNMGDPETLVDFAGWAMREYPAKRYALVIWDHGAGWPKVAVDEDSEGDAITMPELSGALAQIKAANGGKKVDLIGFDACLMAMFEVAVQVAPHGKVLVASEETIPASGWDYQAIAASLRNNPEQDETQLAGVVTSSYLRYYQEVQKDQTVTLSAIDLERMDELKASLDAFSNMLQEMSRTDDGWKNVAYARENAETYADKDWGYVDLGDFADIVYSFSDDDTLRGLARNLTGTISSVVFSNVHGDQHPYASGLSIDSSTDAAGNNTRYMQLDSAQEVKWTDFLGAYYGQREAGASPIDVRDFTADRTAIVPGESLTMSVAIDGRDIQSAELMVFKERESDSGNYYVLVDYIEYAPPVYELEDGSTVQYWSNGENNVQIDWNGTGTAVEDDEGYIHIAVTAIERDSDMYSVEGIYNGTDGRLANASLVFDMRENRLIYIWDYDNAAEIIPERGDRFTAQTPAFDLEEGSDIFYVSYEDLIWGETGWTISNRPLQPGKYLLALDAETFYGQSDLEVLEVEVLGEP